MGKKKERKKEKLIKERKKERKNLFFLISKIIKLKLYSSELKKNRLARGKRARAIFAFLEDFLATFVIVGIL